MAQRHHLSRASLLHARIIPPFGGDTLFANMVRAWDALSPVMRRMLDGLKAEHTAFQRHGREANLARAPESVSHPLVHTHPQSGRKALCNMEGGVTVIAFASALIGASDAMGHGEVSGNRRMDDSRLPRRWWFAT